MENQNRPLKKGRSNSDVEPDTPSITQQPKSSRLSMEDKLICRETSRDNEVINLIKEQLQTNFRAILQEKNKRIERTIERTIG